MNFTKSIAFILVWIWIPTAHAEYYVVCTPPPVTYIYAGPPTQKCRVIHRHYKKHHHPKHHHYVRSRSTASISVYYVWNMAPAVCSCNPCNTCARCSYCGNSAIYYVPENQAYMLDSYNDDFDFDRRTADDIGSDLNIDY